MSKAADMAKVSAKGGFHVLWGLVASTIISSIGTIFIARLLSPDLYGLYAGVVLIGPTLIATFRDFGINFAMTRCAAQYRAEGREDEVRNIFVSGIIFELILGFALSMISFALSGFLATDIFNRPAIAPLIQIASFAILAGGLVNAATAAFTGIEQMELNSVMMISQAIIKTLLTIGLVVIGLGTLGATIGYTIGYLVSGIVGVLLVWTIYRKLPKQFNGKLEIKAYISSMLQFGVPLSIATITGGFLAQFYAFLLPIFYQKDNILIGNYNVAATFVVLITFFAVPVTTMMFPAFSKLDAKKDKETLKNVYQFSVKYASLLVVPVAALIMCLAEPAITTLFGHSYSEAPLFLALLAITYLYPVFGNLSNGTLINGQGQTKFSLYLSILTAAIGFPLGYLLIMSYGVLGLIAVSLTAGLPSAFIAIAWIKKQYDVTVDWGSSARILISSAITATITYLIVAELNFASWIRLVIGVAIFLLILVPMVVLTRAITRTDLENIRVMVSSIGPITGIVNTILMLIEKIMNTMRVK